MKLLIVFGCLCAITTYTEVKQYRSPLEDQEHQIIMSKSAWEHLKEGSPLRAIKKLVSKEPITINEVRVKNPIKLEQEGALPASGTAVRRFKFEGSNEPIVFQDIQKSLRQTQFEKDLAERRGSIERAKQAWLKKISTEYRQRNAVIKEQKEQEILTKLEILYPKDELLGRVNSAKRSKLSAEEQTGLDNRLEKEIFLNQISAGRYVPKKDFNLKKIQELLEQGADPEKLPGDSMKGLIEGWLNGDELNQPKNFENIIKLLKKYGLKIEAIQPDLDTETGW